MAHRRGFPSSVRFSVAIFPPLCELEASETPNLSCYFCNQLLVLTAARDIKQDESVTVGIGMAHFP